MNKPGIDKIAEWPRMTQAIARQISPSPRPPLAPSEKQRCGDVAGGRVDQLEPGQAPDS